MAIDPTREDGTIYVAGVTNSADFGPIPSRRPKAPANPTGNSDAAYLTRLSLLRAADDVAPTVAITSPANNAAFAHVPPITGTASDDLRAFSIRVVAAGN